MKRKAIILMPLALAALASCSAPLPRYEGVLKKACSPSEPDCKAAGADQKDADTDAVHDDANGGAGEDDSELPADPLPAEPDPKPVGGKEPADIKNPPEDAKPGGEKPGESPVALSCEMSESFSFANFPQGWTISNVGRIKDAISNEKVVTDSEKGQVLEVRYGKGTSSPSASRTRGLVPGGTQFLPTLKNSYTNARMEYWFKIPNGFDCVKGGKLPGLASNSDLISGGETADGRNGFSARLMWRENCSAEVYAYLPREENKHLSERYKDELTQNATTKIIYGWSIGRGEFNFPVGKWVKVGIEIKLNDIGKTNGSVMVFFDDKKVFERNEIVYRTVDTLKVGTIFFSSFFGGSDASYAAKKDEYLYFGDMRVCPR